MYEYVLFDLDGTLSDPRPGVFASLRYALGCCGVEEQDDGRLACLIGPPLLPALVDRYRMSEQLAARAYDLYRERFLSDGIEQYTLYPGIEPLLSALLAAGAELSVATARETVVAVGMVERLGLARYFARVAGGADPESAADKAATIRGLLAGRTAAERTATVVVGDMVSDVVAARANGLDVIAVAYGLDELPALEQARPTHLVHTVAELHDLLAATCTAAIAP